jgi:hypothetical protein
MLPIAWFYVILVLCLYALLFYTEMRSRAKRHVKGCPSLPYISRASLDSLIIIEPDLIIVALTDQPGLQPEIPDARMVTTSTLAAFLAQSPQRSLFVIYADRGTPVAWRDVESIVNRLAIPSVSVLKEEHGERAQRNSGMVVAS